MTPVVNIVDRTTKELLPLSVHIPDPLRMAFSVVHKAHRTWRWYRWGKMYSNPDNFLKLSTGHIVNYAIGDNILVRMAAQCVLIATRITDCVEQQAALSGTYQKWMDALLGRHFAEHMVYPWDDRPTHGFLSPSSSYAWKKGLDQAVKRTKIIARQTFKLFSQMFKLSMMMMDTVDAFSLSPSTRNEAVNEFFVNGTKCLDRLTENKEELVNRLNQNKHIIEGVLKGIGAGYKTDQFIEKVSKGLDRAQNVNRTVQRVNQIGNGILKDLLKQGVFGLMSALGLSEYVPDFFVPPPDPNVENGPQRQYGRYAPVHWVTRLDELQKIPAERLWEKTGNASVWEKELLDNKPVRYIKKCQAGGGRPRLPDAPPRPRRFRGQSVQQAFEEAVRLYGYHPSV